MLSAVISAHCKARVANASPSVISVSASVSVVAFHLLTVFVRCFLAPLRPQESDQVLDSYFLLTEGSEELTDLFLSRGASLSVTSCSLTPIQHAILYPGLTNPDLDRRARIVYKLAAAGADIYTLPEQYQGPGGDPHIGGLVPGEGVAAGS
jgi:hypothetical protein